MYYDVLGKVFTQCFGGNDPKHIALTAPQLAYPALKKAATESLTWDGPNGVKSGLVNEIVRLSNVVYANDRGWQTLPLYEAVKTGLVDEDSEAEILSTLVFTCAISKVAPRTLAGTFLEMASSLRDWQFISLTCTEYRDSLPISKPDTALTMTRPQVIA